MRNCTKLILLLIFVSSTCLAETPNDISLVQLVANPEAFHGKLVRVRGFFHFKMEDSGLYISKSDGDYLIGKNGVWVDFVEAPIRQTGPNLEAPQGDGLSPFDEKWVLIEGKFNKERKGHMGLFSGAIENATRIMSLRRFYDQDGK